MSSNDSESWAKAIDKEIESLNENKTRKSVRKDTKWKGTRRKIRL